MKYDILLDENAFNTAAGKMTTLSNDMKNLKTDINNLLVELKTGFDTPAGEKFLKSCENGLLQALEDQANVIDHVSENLKTARQSYQSVFEEYRNLNRMISQI